MIVNKDLISQIYIIINSNEIKNKYFRYKDL